MSFAEDIERRALPLLEAMLAHPFITSVGNGTLGVDRFKYYVAQDYLFLMEYSRVLALATARAPDLKTMAWFSQLLHDTMTTEMDLHRSYCAEFGITAAELEATEYDPTTAEYTGFLLNVASQGSFGELVASLLPCQWGYLEIGDYLARQGEPKSAPQYCKWIRMYTAPEYVAMANTLKDLANKLGETTNLEDLTRMGEAYMTNFEFEYRFWDMAYHMGNVPGP